MNSCSQFPPTPKSEFVIFPCRILAGRVAAGRPGRDCCGPAATRVLGNRGSVPSNAAAHVACWRSVPVVLGRGGMCAMPTAHLARRMQQQLPHRARELSPRVAAPGCLSPYQRDRAACGVTEGGLLPFGTL